MARRILPTGWTVALAVAMAVFIALASEATAGYQKEKREKPTREKTSIYIVVQVNDDFQVVRKEELKEFQKSQQEQYKNAMKAHAEAKKAAKKEKQKFDEPKPMPPKIKPIPGQYSDMSKAQEMADKLRSELEAENQKAKEKSKK